MTVLDIPTPAGVTTLTTRCARSPASATRSSSPTTTSCPRCRTSPTSSATRSGSRARPRRPTPTIVFCGVHFMAETAAILAPEKTVLIPDPRAGCSLAASIDAAELRAWKAEHPGAVVVSYVNTSAEVKAESDYCCTSGNARAVIEAIPADREILFLPDMYLGSGSSASRGASCRSGSASATSTPASGRPTSSAGRPTRPTPSCSSTPNAAARARRWRSATSARTSSRPRRWSSFARELAQAQFVVATETGILHRLEPGGSREGVRRRARGGGLPVHEDDHAREGRDSLRDLKHVVTVEPEIAARARGAIDRMVAIG